MFLEELDRQEIDCLLAQCRWLVQNRRELNITAVMGVAVREATLGNGEADFLLLVDGKVVGVFEGQPPGFNLTTAETPQHLSGLLVRGPRSRLKLLCGYRSNGTTTCDTKKLKPQPGNHDVVLDYRPDSPEENK